MAVCPVCQSEIQLTSQHHGTLFTCPSCSGVFFVDWNGNPEVAASESETGNTPIFEVPDAHTSLDGLETQYSPSPHFDTPTIPEPGFPVAEEPAVIEEAPAYEEAPSDYDLSQPLGMPETPIQESEPMPEAESSGLSDIADFGNADLSQSAFNYTLIISGIDSSALRAQIQEAITDSKFGWNVIQLMAQIKGGVLTIRSVNAVKASILMQRVKYLPVKVSWRQDVLSSSV
ncbi:zf-TFIIB domain-containing protein [Bdellovibrio sp. HCB337]|uniref:zf-TFIIB domain-containing protein n=1 Tax=Bdellovibrio sp. HCB337 TaxID=3394358 RepID=UPI0039A64F97